MNKNEAIGLIEDMMTDEKQRWRWAETQLNAISDFIEDQNKVTEREIRIIKNIRNSISPFEAE